MFSFMVSFKGVFLEGMEVVFIVITFGLNANNIPAAAICGGRGGGLRRASIAVVARASRWR